MLEAQTSIKHEQHKKLVQAIVAEILSIDKVTGCMLIGSVARGDAYPESDLDFIYSVRGRTKEEISF